MHVSTYVFVFTVRIVSVSSVSIVMKVVQVMYCQYSTRGGVGVIRLTFKACWTRITYTVHAGGKAMFLVTSCYRNCC